MSLLNPGQATLPSLGTVLPTSPSWDRTAEWPPKRYDPPPQQKAQLLGKRLGGATKLMRAVVLFNKRLMADAELREVFRGVTSVVQNAKHVQLLRYAVGGPEAYSGADTGSVHEHLFAVAAITRAHFYALVGHLIDTLEELQVQQDVIEDARAHLMPLADKFTSNCKQPAEQLPGPTAQPALLSRCSDAEQQAKMSSAQNFEVQPQSAFRQLKFAPSRTSQVSSASNSDRRLSLELPRLKRNSMERSFRSSSLSKVLMPVENLQPPLADKGSCGICVIAAHANFQHTQHRIAQQDAGQQLTAAPAANEIGKFAPAAAPFIVQPPELQEHCLMAVSASRVAAEAGSQNHPESAASRVSAAKPGKSRFFRSLLSKRSKAV